MKVTYRNSPIERVFCEYPSLQNISHTLHQDTDGASLLIGAFSNGGHDELFGQSPCYKNYIERSC
jgi:hypothetical protein